MAKLKKLFWALAAIPLLVGCSKDDFPEQGGSSNNSGDGEGLYMALTIEMPGENGTRSSTTTDGASNADPATEVGTTIENSVGSVLIVLADSKDNSFILAGTVPGPSITPIPEANSYNTTVKFSKSDLVEYYTNNTADKKVNVFAFCNYTSDFLNYIDGVEVGDKTWYNYKSSLTEIKGSGTSGPAVTNSIWATDNFVMSNSKLAKRELPSTIDGWDYCKTFDTAFNLSGSNTLGEELIDNSGAIPVERLACRFDFKDGSELGGNSYHVVTDSDNEPIIDIELQKMMLTNMSKAFYMLPRVSADGLLATAALCGSETATNYVVGPNATEFKWDKKPEEFVYSTYFNYPFFTPTNDYNMNVWDVCKISDVLSGNADNYKQEYKVWRYATENVIPAPVANQTYGKTTIVVFKGRLKVSEAAAAKPEYAEMAKYLNNVGGILNGKSDPILYKFNGNLYFTWEELRNAAIKASVQMTNDVPDIVTVEEDGKTIKRFANVSRGNPLYKAVFGDGGMGTITWGTTTYSDVEEPAEDPKSSNYLWDKWKKAGQKGSGDDIDNMRSAMTTATIALYQSSEDKDYGNGYYCYYFYRNRHNDNNKPGEMGPMEFATVRNNVYKLAVTKISQLGHPRIPQNDPEPPGPDTPDEEDDVYLTVTCKVLPWVVRVNNIEF